MYISMKQKPTP